MFPSTPPTCTDGYTFPTCSLILLLIFRTNITCIRNRKLKNICIVLRAARAGHAWRAVFTSVHNRTRSIAEISFAPSFIRPLMYSCVRPFIHSFVRSFVPSFVCSFSRSSIHSSVHSSIRSFVPSFVRSFLRPFVSPFVRSVVLFRTHLIFSFLFCFRWVRLRLLLLPPIDGTLFVLCIVCTRTICILIVARNMSNDNAVTIISFFHFSFPFRFGRSRI